MEGFRVFVTTPPTSFDNHRYRVQGVIHRGLHATIYEVLDNETKERMALKVLELRYADPAIAQAMFYKEVESLSRFKHPAVIALRRYFTDPETQALCIALELIPRAISLRRLIEHVESGDLEAKSVLWCLDVLEQLIGGLEQAHRLGIVHRDFNPNNVVIDRGGEGDVIKIVDFGIAKFLNQFGTTHTTLQHFLTYPFASPEQSSHRDLNIDHDYFTYGLVAAAVLTWSLPKQEHLLSESEIELLLEPLNTAIKDPLYAEKIRVLLRSLTHPEPHERARPYQVRRVLQEVRVGLSERPLLGLVVPGSIEEKFIQAGFLSPQAFFADLNEGTLARYRESERNGRTVNVYFYGKSTWALTTTDALRGNQEQLVMVDAGRNDPEIHRQVTRGASYCRFQLRPGQGNAKSLMDELFERRRHDERLREAERERRAYFKVASFVLDFEEDQAKSLVLTYQELDTKTHPDFYRVQVVGLSAFNPERGEHEPVPDDRINDALANLDENSRFSIKGRNQERLVGSFYAYLPDARTLVIRKEYNTSLSKEGTLSYVDHGKLVSIRRQRSALGTFIKDDAINPYLADRILRPKSNSYSIRAPIALIQDLKPEREVQQIVESALSAQDFYLIQGPPGTGKTTLIAEIMAQILKRDKRARILLTAQPNEAVNHAFGEFRTLTDDRYRSLLYTRDSNELKTSFEAWAEEVICKSRQAMDTLLPTLSPKQYERITEILQTWHTRLPKTRDVLPDYVRSVQVYGATCLKVPVLTDLTRDEPFDWVIIDEAAKALDTEVLAVLVTGRRFILVGDQRQLPPHLDRTVENALTKYGFDPQEVRTSLFERLYKGLPIYNKTRLRRQFRMHSTIGHFDSDLFYQDLGGLEHGTPDEERDMPLPIMRPYAHKVLWFDVRGTERQAYTSRYNPDEAEAIRRLLKQLDKESRELGEAYTVSVITPYLAQVATLEDELKPESRLWTNLKIAVATIDSFQGKQSDVVVYSFVRSRPEGLEFVADPQRLNVAFSRAKRALFIFGNTLVARSHPLLETALGLLPDGNIIGGGK
jgi:serine/threonine protein kinase/energy-coupling factor transporter ATP-binding protein EcfA2